IESRMNIAANVVLYLPPQANSFGARRNFRGRKMSETMSTEQNKESETMGTEQNKEVATLAGGCFWCLEAVYKDLRGVLSVVSGYAGGDVLNPTYYQVCEGTTGHAEVVQITFDPRAVTFRELLEVFFTIHDPTTLNRQGADVGTQYRSAIFYHTPEQRETAEQVINELNSAHIWDA